VTNQGHGYQENRSIPTASDGFGAGQQVADAACALFGLGALGENGAHPNAPTAKPTQLDLIGNSIGGMVALTAAKLLVHQGGQPKSS
jgi:hypothetical protein